MDWLYLLCVIVAGLALTTMTVIIPWGVYTRYVLDRGSAWPEPMGVLLMIAFTFLGGAACYRAGSHISVTMFADALAEPYRRLVGLLAELLMALLAVLMLIWGGRLVMTTWHQVIAEFSWLPVGVTYLPIPVGAAITLLFILERLVIGPPPRHSIVYREPVEQG